MNPVINAPFKPTKSASGTTFKSIPTLKCGDVKSATQGSAFATLVRKRLSF